MTLAMVGRFEVGHNFVVFPYFFLCLDSLVPLFFTLAQKT